MSGKGVTLGVIFLELLPAALLCALFAAAGVVHVTSRVLAVDVGYRLSKLEHEGRELTRERDRLKLELATLRSPAKLERIAREKLGMVPPPPSAVITVRSQEKGGPRSASAVRAGQPARGLPVALSAAQRERRGRR